MNEHMKMNTFYKISKKNVRTRKMNIKEACMCKIHVRSEFHEKVSFKKAEYHNAHAHSQIMHVYSTSYNHWTVKLNSDTPYVILCYIIYHPQEQAASDGDSEVSQRG
jgi:hypothetical protein